MNKCKCIKKSLCYVIDDSFDVNSTIKGGAYSFDVDEIYEYRIENTAFGICYIVNSNNNETGFDEKKFNNIFVIIKKEL